MQGEDGKPRVHAGRLVLRIALGAGSGGAAALAAVVAWHRHPVDLPMINLNLAVAMTALYVPLALITFIAAVRWAGGWDTAPRRAVQILTFGAALGVISIGLIITLDTVPADPLLARLLAALGSDAGDWLRPALLGSAVGITLTATEPLTRWLSPYRHLAHGGWQPRDGAQP